MNISGIRPATTDATQTRASAEQARPAPAQRQDVAAPGKGSPPAARIDLQEQLIEAAEVITELVQSLNMDQDLQFKVDDATGASVITVLDGETGEVIRRFPTEESLAMARYIAEFSEVPTTGLLTDSLG